MDRDHKTPEKLSYDLEEMEDLEISGPKRARNTKKRNVIVEDDDNSEMNNGNDPFGTASNLSQQAVPRKKNFMDKFCSGDLKKVGGKSDSVTSGSQGNTISAPKIIGKSAQSNVKTTLKPKPGYKVVSKAVVKEVDGYTEVVYEDRYEKMTPEEMQEKDNQRKKSQKIEVAQVNVK